MEIEDHLKMHYQKMQKFCVYQERCQQEVREKLQSFDLSQRDIDSIIATLISEGYVNEERFAIQFAGGKFRIKHWGKLKINAALQRHNISSYCINKALKELPETDYYEKMCWLMEREFNKITEENILIKNNKVAKALITKGYEPDLIWREIGSGF